jgi:hypothetical protein
VIGGHGMWLHPYLPTRTFERAVHGLDIAAAVALSLDLSAVALAESASMAAKIVSKSARVTWRR